MDKIGLFAQSDIIFDKNSGGAQAIADDVARSSLYVTFDDNGNAIISSTAGENALPINPNALELRIVPVEKAVAQFASPPTPITTPETPAISTEVSYETSPLTPRASPVYGPIVRSAQQVSRYVYSAITTLTPKVTPGLYKNSQTPNTPMSNVDLSKYSKIDPQSNYHPPYGTPPIPLPHIPYIYPSVGPTGGGYTGPNPGAYNSGGGGGFATNGSVTPTASLAVD